MSHRILIVDDEAPIRDVLRRALRRQPYEIAEAANADEALRLLAQRPADLVFSDYNMPGLCGLDLLREVQARHPDTIRILMTGHADVRLATTASEDEVIYHFVRKPWDPDELLLLFGLALRHLDLRRENVRLLGLVQAQRRIITEMEARDPARRPAP